MSLDHWKIDGVLHTGGGWEAEQGSKGRRCCITHTHTHGGLSLSALAPPVETSGSPCPPLSGSHRGWGCSCPAAGSQEPSGLNGLLRPLDYRLSSPRALTASATTNSHFCCLLSDLSSDTFSPHLSPRHLPLIPCANRPSAVFLPFFSCPRAERPCLNQRKKNSQTYKHTLTCTHTHTHTHTCTHIQTQTCACVYVLSFSLCISQTFYPRASPRATLSKIFGLSRESIGR